MGNFRYLLLFCSILSFFPIFSAAQTVADYTVQVEAQVQTNPPRIILTWPADANASNYSISRKTKTGTNFGLTIANLAGTDTMFTDTNVVVGEAWEYRIRKQASGYTGWGFIYAGIETEAIEFRGKMILIVDSTYKDSLAWELARFEADLVGDGWEVIRHDVDRGDSVPDVKALIQADYLSGFNNVQAVTLIGHVPVPYSGNIYPDGHTNHIGAWPADVYYAEMSNSWPDASVNNTSASRTANHNVPGDGKFDRSTLPSDAELMLGRIDFANMTTFAESELELLRRYLNKDHAFKHKEFTAIEQAVVDDNFGVFSGEIFAGNGWRNFAPKPLGLNSTAKNFNLDARSMIRFL